jgi:hypothetical protein
MAEERLVPVGDGDLGCPAADRMGIDSNKKKL